MSLFARSVFILWVLMLFLSSANNVTAVTVNQLLIEVTNSLDGNLDLTVSCNNIDPAHHLLRPGTYHEWIYSGDISSSKPPFFCSFQWQGASHSFNMYVPIWDFDCEECHWYIKQSGPCRWYYGTTRSYRCSKWN
ncbi:Plant self-incompatibility S1 [Spatholobus suberectus]|nr:Plant self-incompatibility S1 [Spatholobus suberectus]